MKRILFSLCFVLMFSVSAHAIVARPGGTADRMMPAPAPRPPQVMCTQEAKICPDGTGVGRTGPNCEFAPCPGEQAGGGAAPMVCAKDAKACPDGSTVGRVPPSCAFALCPGEESEEGEEGQNPDDVVSSPPVEENPGQPTPMPPIGGGVACPMLAKVCPDGSSVSPGGPNCEMPPCPGETSPGEPSPIETMPGGTDPGNEYRPNGTAPGGAPGVAPGNPGPEGGSEGQ